MLAEIYIYIIHQLINMHKTRLLILLALISVLSEQSLIVERHFDTKKVAEGIPLTVIYTVSNTYDS